MRRGLIRACCFVQVFGVRPLMPRVAQKLRSEAKPGALVLSYRFELPLGARDGELDAALIYEREEMRVYRMRTAAITPSSDDDDRRDDDVGDRRNHSGVPPRRAHAPSSPSPPMSPPPAAAAGV